MQNREQIRELILKMGEDGKEINIVELAVVHGIVDEQAVTDKLVKNQVMQRIRSMVHRIYSNEGMKVRSVRKNVYKVVDENSSKDCHEELVRLMRAANRYEKKVNDYKDFMLKKGHPVQTEMAWRELILEGGDANASNQKQGEVRAVVTPSAKPKKAANS